VELYKPYRTIEAYAVNIECNRLQGITMKESRKAVSRRKRRYLI